MIFNYNYIKVSIIKGKRTPIYDIHDIHNGIILGQVKFFNLEKCWSFFPASDVAIDINELCEIIKVITQINEGE